MASQRLTRMRALTGTEIEELEHVPDALLHRVRLVRTNLLPPFASGMTIGRFVLLRGRHISDGPSALLAHELVHVRQFVEQGPLRFLYRYVTDYAKNLIRYRNHRKAYLEIPYEVEAREEADRWMAKRRSNHDLHINRD